MRRALALFAVAVFFLGAGCSLESKLDWKLPFSLNPASTLAEAVAATKGLSLKPGLAFTVRPSTLGVSASVDETLGLDDQALKVAVLEATDDRRTVSWQGASASGTFTVTDAQQARAMLLPAFWPPGKTMASKNGGLWLSRAAFDELERRGATEWRIGLNDDPLGTLSAAFKAFNALATELSASATATEAVSPFTLTKKDVIDAFPLTIDGSLVLVRAVTASSWFADFVVLDNPDDPLILKVTVNPAASPALKALAPAKVRWDELGYEITSVSRP